MPARIGSAVWEGTLKEGKGTMKLGSGAYEGPYSFQSRFENGSGTNPEELIGAAEAGCFSMALSSNLEKAGHPGKTHQHDREREARNGGGRTEDHDDRSPGGGERSGHGRQSLPGTGRENKEDLPGLRSARRDQDQPDGQAGVGAGRGVGASLWLPGQQLPENIS